MSVRSSILSRSGMALIQRVVLGLAVGAILARMPAAEASAPPVNLLPNGDLSQAAPHQDPPGPAHWDRPDGLGVQWCDAPGGGKAMRLDTRVSEQAMVAQWHRVGITQWDFPHATAGAVGENYGLSLYSEAMAVEPGVAYRVSADCLGPAGGIKVWVRGYAEVDGEQRRLWEHLITGSGAADDAWWTLSAVVHPTLHRPAVRTIRIMLYAYYPDAVYLVPPPAGRGGADRGCLPSGPNRGSSTTGRPSSGPCRTCSQWQQNSIGAHSFSLRSCSDLARSVEAWCVPHLLSAGEIVGALKVPRLTPRNCCDEHQVIHFPHPSRGSPRWMR